MTDAPTQPPVIKLGDRYTIQRPDPEAFKLWVIIWGASGIGKTTLASTAPGLKLWILFDPAGADVVANRNDVIVLDLTGEDRTIVEKFKDEDPFGISRLLVEHNISTVVVDSATMYSDIALARIVEKQAKSTNLVSIETPGEGAYAGRNALVIQMLTNVQRAVSKAKRNLIVIMHEKVELDAQKFRVTTFSVSAGLHDKIPLRFSEVWWLTDDGKGRVIKVRGDRLHKPMKTRMFNPGEASEFAWNYDPETQVGEGIATWYERWRANGGAKIPLPASKAPPKK